MKSSRISVAAVTSLHKHYFYSKVQEKTKKDISNEKQKIKEKYNRKFLESKEWTQNKTQTTVRRKRGNKRPVKIKLRKFRGWEEKQVMFSIARLMY